MSYFSNLLTATKTKYQTFRAASSEEDGDTEDDSHLTRVLRNYYIESGRPLPPWLPAPPSSATPPPQNPRMNGMNLRRPGQQPQTSQSLSDIFDAPTPPSRNRFNQQPNPPPLFNDSPPPQSSSAPPAGAPLTAQQRIRERLWGGRKSEQPQQQQPQQQQRAPPPPASTGRVEMPSMPGFSDGGRQPYMGAGMPWDDGYGGGYDMPATMPQQAPPPQRRPGLPTGPRSGYTRR